ncbi:MAG TPA: hypothetical protein VME01_03365, partial [Solirubrobacteraceae bacterium]|nr:hypothetical protein [Solirubrobacteraceae bacterium]
MRISRKLAALGAFFVIAAAVAGCGSSIPGNSVASIAGNPITTQAYDHWMYIAAKEEASEEPGAPVIVPDDPPNFNGCIKQIHEFIPSYKSTPDSTLRSDCKQVFSEFNGQVMTFLIEGYWYQAQAYKQGIKYTSAQLNKDFVKARKQEFPTIAEYDAYLKSSGLTQQDLLFQIRVNHLFDALVTRATK